MFKKLTFVLLLTLSFAFPALAQEEADNSVFRQWASDATASTQHGVASWSAIQATGAPNASSCSDSRRAWASATTNEVATLTVVFNIPVVPSEINIYQNKNPGAITGITLITLDGDEIAVEGTGTATEDCPSIVTFAIEGVEAVVSSVAITVDQSALNDWSEIDAVEIVGVPDPEAPVNQWAAAAEASSQFQPGNWSAGQATRAPNSLVQCEDTVHAWAAATVDEVVTLTVHYNIPVVPSEVNIYQNFNPGAVTSITFLTPDGEEIVVEGAGTPPDDCSGIHTFTVEGVDVPVNGIILTVDQRATQLFSEIDAVQLVGTIRLGE